MLQVVIDCNVFISGLLNPGNARDLTVRLEQGEFLLMYPERLILELLAIEHRPKLASRIKPARLTELIDLIRSRAIEVKLEVIPHISRDPKDDDYLACAQDTDSDYIVTGDQDLLTLKSHGITKIITPAEFLSHLKSGT